MHRFLIAVVLIANLLACPLRCSACQVAGVPDAVRAETPCCCCPNPTDVKPSLPENDDAPTGDCDCPSCICEGATIQQPTKLSDVESLVSFERR